MEFLEMVFALIVKFLGSSVLTNILLLILVNSVGFLQSIAMYN